MEILSLPEEGLRCGVSFLHQNSVKETHALHSHDFFEIFFVAKGRAMHFCNGINECCVSGTAVFIRPNDCHAYDFINQYDMELISIGISKEVMEEIFNFLEIDSKSMIVAKHPFSTCYDRNDSEKICKRLMKLGSPASDREQRVHTKSIVGDLLLDMLEQTNTPLKIPFWLENLISEMSKPENFCIGLRQMIKLSCVSQNHLNRELKKYLGMTPTEFINSKRIAYACKLLIENKYSVTQIAGMCGFDTFSNFYDNFKKVYDVSPREFVKNRIHQYRE